VPAQPYKLDTAAVYDTDDTQVRVPSECHLCGRAPFHTAPGCKVLASLGELERRLAEVDALVETTRSSHWKEVHWQLQRWHQVVVRRKQDALGVDIARLDAPYEPYETPCDVPDKFWALKLQRRSKGSPDPRRVAVGMHPWWPWYPPPTATTVEFRYAKAAIQEGFAIDTDREVFDRVTLDVAYWQRGLAGFLNRRAAEERELEEREREAKAGAELSAEALKILENDVRAMVDPLAFARDLHQDQDLPPLVRHTKWHGAVRMEYDGGDLPNGQELWLFSNADWYSPPPSLAARVMRLDGRYGEHDYVDHPQWHVRGKFYRAFCEGGFYGELDARCHSSEQGDFAWYEINWADFDIQQAVDGSILYKMSDALIASLEVAWDMLWEQVTFWRSVRKHAQDYPHEAEEQARCVMRTLKGQALSERDMRSHVVGCQREIKDMRGWVRWHRTLNKLLKLKVQLEETGTQVAPRADAESQDDGLMQVRGVWTSDMALAKLVGQVGSPVWVLQAMPKGYACNLPALHCVIQRFEQRRWSDASAVPVYVQPIRRQPFAPHFTAVPNNDATAEDDDDMWTRQRQLPPSTPSTTLDPQAVAALPDLLDYESYESGGMDLAGDDSAVPDASEFGAHQLALSRTDIGPCCARSCARDRLNDILNGCNIFVSRRSVIYCTVQSPTLLTILRQWLRESAVSTSRRAAMSRDPRRSAASPMPRHSRQNAASPTRGRRVSRSSAVELLHR